MPRTNQIQITLSHRFKSGTDIKQHRLVIKYLPIIDLWALIYKTRILWIPFLFEVEIVHYMY